MMSLQDFSYTEIKEIVTGLGYPAFRADQVFDMVVKNKDYGEATNLPNDLKEKLKNLYPAFSVRLYKEFVGKDGAKKYLYELNDGNIVEGVYMPHNYGDTLCVSTQIGCRMGCAFCASGIGGLIRHLTAGEMLGQVYLANRLNGGGLNRAVTNIVLMGSGEPLDNYDNVMKFLTLVNAEKGLNVSYRNISLSTVGIVPKLKELADSGVAVTLSISLHAPTDEKRSRLIPMNLKYGIAEILSAAKYYFDKTGRRIIFEYALAEGENSDKESAMELIKLLRGLPCHVNLIPLNYVKEKRLKTANKNRVKEFLTVLENNKISATLRRSMGADIGGACGQLRNKFVEQKSTENTPE